MGTPMELNRVLIVDDDPVIRRVVSALLDLDEYGLLGSHVHLDKGCYPGQETVARVHNLGQVQRRLAGLRFQPPANGAPQALPASRTDLVTDDGRRAGQLRSVVDHPELGPIGLAYVRRVVDDGRLVRAGDHIATVVDLPFR